MKKIVLVLLIFTFKISYTQQSIKAIYKKELVGYKTIKQDSFKTKSLSKLKQANNFIINRYNESSKTVKKLDFEFLINNDRSVFKVINVGLLQDEKGFSGALVSGINLKGEYYSNSKEKKSIHKKELFGEQFLVKQPFLKVNWNLKNETKKIGKFNCYKATAILEETSSKGNKKTSKIVCWFTNEIATNLGPAGFNGLPGLIVRLEKGTTSLTLKNVLISNELILIKEPTQGIKMENQKEFEKKGKEMFYKHIGKRRNRN